MARRNAYADMKEQREKQIALYRGQCEKHREVVEGAAKRTAYLENEIAKREAAIAQLRAELDDLPRAVVHSRSVLSRLNDNIATLRAKIENAKTKQRKREQLARLKEQYRELSKD